MRIIHTTSLLLIINIVTAELFQGNTKNQKREKRQNNSYEFFRQLLSQNNYHNHRQNSYSYNYGIPKGATTNQSPFYPNSRDKQTTNINHIKSDHVTIINNYYPEPTACPCEKYVRNDNGELECLCPRRQIFIRCATNTVCVLKNMCIQGYADIDGYNDQSNLCDESSHVCCLPRVKTKMQNNLGKTQEIYNQIINSTVGNFSNPITKYIILGNLYINSDNSEHKNMNNTEIQLPQPLPSTDLTPLSDTHNIPSTQKTPEEIPAENRNKESTRSPSVVGINPRTNNPSLKVPNVTETQNQTMKLIPMMVKNDSLIIPMMVIKMNNEESTLSVLSKKDLEDVFLFYTYVLKEANIK